MTKIKLYPTVENFLNQNATVITVNGEKWYYMPYWLKKEQGSDFELVKFEHLPEQVKEFIKAMRDEKRPK
jgi:hypothetical protein